MPRKWHHGHSLGAGFLAGAGVMAYNAWVLYLAAFVVGVVLTLAVVNARRFVHWIARGRSPLTMRQWRNLQRRVGAMRPDDRIPY